MLGATGRNFAAGMSGGVAFVFDEAGDFAAHCNTAQVALEPVEVDLAANKRSGAESIPERSGKFDARHLGMSDEALLKGLIDKHAKLTGSPHAKKILDNWASARASFVKVMPHEYRRALAEIGERARLIAEQEQEETR